MPADRSNFVLRLLVVRVEGVLIPPVSSWSGELAGVDESIGLSGKELFPEWVRHSSLSESGLRTALTDLASGDRFRLSPELRDVLEYAHDHSPIRTALLSTGPQEWLDALVESLGIARQVDLPYSFDRYKHGSRRTLLHFLMNRFIAGRERTLFLGRELADERMADREETRFRSLEPPPDDALNPEDWGWSTDRLLEFMKEKEPTN